MGNSVVDLGAAAVGGVADFFSESYDFLFGTPEASASGGYYKNLGPGARQYFLGPGEDKRPSLLESIGFADGGSPAVELQDDGSLPGVDALRYMTPQEVEDGSYNFLQNMEEKMLDHLAAAQSVHAEDIPVRQSLDMKRYHYEEAEKLRDQIEQFKERRASAIQNYPESETKLYMKEGEAPYVRGFPDDLVQGFHEGGIVGQLQNLSQVSSGMGQKLNQMVNGQAGNNFDLSYGGGSLPPPLPPVDNSVYQPGGGTSSSGPVASISNFGPDVGNGDLFGGFETPDVGFTGTGNDGFGSVSQGPLDFFGSAQNYFNPGMGGQREFGPMGATPEQMVERARGRLAQRDVKPPELQAYLNHIIQTGGNPTMMAPPPQLNKFELGAPLMGVGPTGGVTSGQMPPGFTPLSSGELGFTEDMMGPIQGYAGGSKYFDESTGLYSGPTGGVTSGQRVFPFSEGGSPVVELGAGEPAFIDMGDMSMNDALGLVPGDRAYSSEGEFPGRVYREGDQITDPYYLGPEYNFETEDPRRFDLYEDSGQFAPPLTDQGIRSFDEEGRARPTYPSFQKYMEIDESGNRGIAMAEGGNPAIEMKEAGIMSALLDPRIDLPSSAEQDFVRASGREGSEGSAIYYPEGSLTFEQVLEQKYGYRDDVPRDDFLTTSEIMRAERPRHDMPTYQELEDARAHALMTARLAQQVGPETATKIGGIGEFIDKTFLGATPEDAAMDTRNNAFGASLLRKAGINATPQQLAEAVDRAVFDQLDVILGREKSQRRFKSPDTGIDIYFPRDRQGYFNVKR